jgi:hypothetical protein
MQKVKCQSKKEQNNCYIAEFFVNLQPITLCVFQTPLMS